MSYSAPWRPFNSGALYPGNYPGAHPGALYSKYYQISSCFYHPAVVVLASTKTATEKQKGENMEKTYGIIIERRETRSTTVEVTAPNVTQAKEKARELCRQTAQFMNVPTLSLNFVAVDSWECDR